MLTGVADLQVPRVTTRSPEGKEQAVTSPQLGRRPSTPRACKSPQSPGLVLLRMKLRRILWGVPKIPAVLISYAEHVLAEAAFKVANEAPTHCPCTVE